MVWLSFLIALLAGAANPFQSGTNAQLNKQLGQPLPTTSQAVAVKSWAWLGGVISIASTMAGLVLAQKLGSGIFTGLTLTASLITSVVLDHLGLIGFRQHAASPGRLVGCALMIAGVWIITRF